MSSRPSTSLKTEPFEGDSLFDFNQGTAASSSNQDTLSPFDKSEERQPRFNGPSHDYHQYKQQVGLPVGSMANLPPMSQPRMFDGYSSGIGDMGMDSFGSGWSSGTDIDLDADMNVDFNNPQSSMPAMFFPATANNMNNYVDRNSIGERVDEPPSSVVRLWPGMHSQQARQAAMAKQQQNQAIQQCQMKMQAQQAAYREGSVAPQQSEASSQTSSKRGSHITKPHVEDSISRLLNQMQQQSNMGDDESSPSDMLPHIAQMKKDEEEIDVDECFLNSDEGKKLSSKERRQLRNKVSARAFRSRRKEYVGQLEGEVALKAQEAASLRQENTALLQENDCYRGFIETLLRHPAFTPFINDISKDPAVPGMSQQQTQHLLAPQQQQQQQSQPSATPVQQRAQPQQTMQQPDVKPEYLNFDASQLEIPCQQQNQQQQQQIGLAMIPEENFGKLNLNGFQQSMNFNSYGVNAYAVTEVPTGPDPIDLLATLPARLPTATAAASTADLDCTLLLLKLNGAPGRMKAA
ncbi:hypothetical protein B0A55_10852 [Friedmanniomyces simplex]|uniref:BZIP domain-containing protein n=1 Tax=Friedmanniomyces simplex TaxID=329884 RepID=A0A4U0X2G4_9PEZI|nr:hypothetical protein B0A55_10852 [Friedmanniomyces simplex]